MFMILTPQGPLNILKHVPKQNNTEMYSKTQILTLWFSAALESDCYRYH